MVEPSTDPLTMVAERAVELKVAKEAVPAKVDVPETERVFNEVELETLRVPEEAIPAVEIERAETVALPSSTVTREEDRPSVEDVFNSSVYESAIVRPVNVLMLMSPNYRLVAPSSHLLNHSLANSTPLVGIPLHIPRCHTCIRL
jgi:hypothetical protein